ncbi:Rne/Rng family ribonuclease [Methylobacterium sp. J-059]|uniref:Rne/Rng family ribonuclease n=1 Tax=Methylobacterium sp. J-059 TaxID=2836643 RepID=UPI001FBC024C|nr:ribonuclease E/G [Methylobacterium sp. J-059]MCJ2042278.1 Rne/Rng family ribonuclease [Methylobacterium sp. J-059]
MANNKMLIDAMHPEETRVVTVHGSRVEEFDFEAANRRQLRGNIYLAKVTRVEPSLQAAFVEYGGNRHGFLAFSEIHPDYYQIPLADRQALLEDEARDAEEHREREERRRKSPRNNGRRVRGRRAEAAAAKLNETVSAEDVAHATETSHEASHADEHGAQAGEPRHDEAQAHETQGHETHVHEAPAHETGSGADHAGGTASGEAPAEGAIAPGSDASASLPETAIGEPAAETQDTAEAHAPEADAPRDAAAPEAADAAPRPEAIVAVAESLTVAEAPAASEDESDEDESDDEDEDEDSDDEDEDGDDEESDEDEGDEDPDAEPKISQVGGNGDALGELPERPRSHRRHYKIQEVIKRRQIILVQVVKEERGTKGAALTTYLSLAGRYSVLMPNTGRGGGISRKITSAADRKRLKETAQALEVPDGMGVILRTAGASRTMPEIKRDFEYLMRLWESVRELTLSSTAPALVYEEGSLIKRAIRDLYNKDLDEVLVSGEAAYAEARDFMRMLMPQQAKVVKPYRDPTPIFAKHGVEQQLDAMFSTHVTLKSGGYLVINPTEALVSIDVNSGRSTREHDIEDTALRTNMEAAEEVARQLRLRDLAGLVVIDFIDMEEKRNNRAVEKKLNDCLKNDRARIQVGRISPFGLMEMSRQRIRTGVLESSSIPCVHCGGSGFVRATASVALHILRAIEEALLKASSHNLILRTRTEVALYILNQKRGHLHELEMRFGVSVTIAADERLGATTAYQLDRGEPAQRAEGPVTGIRAVAISPISEIEEDDGFEEAEDETAEEALAQDALGEADADDEAEDAREAGAERSEKSDEGDGQRRRRRRRRKRGGRPEGGEAERGAQAGAEAGDEDAEGDAILGDINEGEATEGGEAEPAEAQARESAAPADGEEDAGGRRRRRGRRGGRGRAEGRGRDGGEATLSESPLSEGAAFEADASPDEAGDPITELQPEQPVSAEAVAEAIAAAVPPVETAVELPVSSPVEAAPAEAPAQPSAEPAAAEEPAPAAPARAPEPVAVVLSEPSDPDRPKRAGWWSRTKAALTGE